MATSKDSRERSERLLFPDRKLCRKCRKPFTFIVVDRQYCGYDCAGLRPPDVRKKPRSCWTEGGIPKACYFTPDDADRAAREDEPARDPFSRLHSYYCDRHHMWHVGRMRREKVGSLADWFIRVTAAG